jgi:hypothetical protein
MCSSNTCDMYMCRLRHINDPVLSSLKMECIRFFFIWKLLHIFQMVPPPIIRNANNCIYSIWYLSERYAKYQML